MSTLRPIPTPGVYAEADIERIRGRKPETLDQEKARLRRAAREFESLLMYQMLKAMRKTIGESSFAKDSPMSGSLGKDTFTEMFDVHLARDMVTGGNGSIADILYQSLEKTITAEFNGPEEPVEIQPLQKTCQDREPMEISRPELPVERAGSRPVKIAPVPSSLRPEQVAHPLPVAASKTTTVNADPTARSAPRIVPRLKQTVPSLEKTEAYPAAGDPILRKFGRLIDEAAETHQIDSALIRAVIRVESGGDANAVSPAGAKGLMQLMDSTAAELGVEDAFDERENIMSGAKYLRRLMDRFGDLKLALAAYNAGPGTVDRHGGVPPYAETKLYVEKVLDTLSTYRPTDPSTTPKGSSDANR